jgi:hypothetical protein
MKKIILVLLLISSTSAFASNINPFQEFHNTPFSADLDRFERQMNTGRTTMIIGLSSSILMFTSSTLLVNFANPISGSNAWNMPNGAFRPLLYTSYAINLVALGTTIYGFIRWERASRRYHETLRLQNQWFNLVRE